MHYEPTEAEINGLTGDETAQDNAQAAAYAEEAAARAEDERQAYHHDDEQRQAAWEEGEHEQMQAYVEGY